MEFPKYLLPIYAIQLLQSVASEQDTFNSHSVVGGSLRALLLEALILCWVV